MEDTTAIEWIKKELRTYTDDDGELMVRDSVEDVAKLMEAYVVIRLGDADALSCKWDKYKTEENGKKRIQP